MALAVALALRALSPPPPPRVVVLVARTDLAAGHRLDTHDLRRASFDPDTVPAGLADHPVGQVLASPLRQGEPVTDARLVGPALTLESGLVAVPVRLPDAGAVALLHVGDRIDVLGADPKSGTARILVSGAVVLALPADPSQSASNGLTGRLVVVGAPEEGATTLAAASVQEFLSFRFSR